MSKLTFVGLGLGDQGVSIGGIKAIKEADMAYLEYYTTPFAPRLLSEVEGAAGRTLTVVDRSFVEDGKAILDEASAWAVVLAVQGDPMIATTHSDLMVRAISRGIKTEIVHGATIAAAAASASGLQYYKFGATVTFTRESKNYHEQVYKRVHQNLLDGSHTLLLLEYDVEGGQGTTPESLMDGLQRAEANYKRGVVSEETFMVILSRVGTQQESIRAGSISELRSLDYGQPPYVAIVPGRLHFAEKEALAAVTGIEEEKVRDNASDVRRTAQVLIPKYVEKAKKALEAGRSILKEGYEQVFENAELYTKDAEKFLAEGQDELAMLSIGYAEGLIDSLTFSGKLKLEW